MFLCCERGEEESIEMRILHIANVRDRPQSGVSTVVPKHLRYQRDNADVALLNITTFTPPESEGAYRTYFLSDFKDLSALPDGYATPDLVVFHEIYWLPFIRIYKHFKGMNIPYIVVPHGSSTKTAQRQKYLKKLVGNMLHFKTFMNSAMAIHYLSDFDRQQTIFPRPTPLVQGSGIPLSSHKKRKFSQSGLKLIYVGRLDVIVKGLDLMINMAVKHKDQLKRLGVTITIAGADAAGGELWLKKAISANALDDIVILKPAIFGEEKIRTILEHDVFFQFSRTEAQCLGLMEAMDLGMPSLVTPGTSFYDIAKDFETAVPIDTEEDAHRAILFLLENRGHLLKIGSNASAYIESRYDWPSVGRATVKQYRDLLGQ